ncbi:hypothetical protein DPMN_055782 [Dreissena polymorpha]|uniref:Uncharacterized protein n=1 Tax=Dreissena polymorpha TaxID=45954 RepID=A0A9D4HSK6_DREPO|nr:hypothetical protein DPMN_055782 [Dreissena polymorpha]
MKPRQEGAQVKAGSIPVEPRYTLTPPALTGAILASDAGIAMATPRFNPGVQAECRFTYVL